MRKFISSTFFLCFYFALQAQYMTENTAMGVSFSGLGNNDAFYWEEIVGAGGYDSKGYHSFGVTFIRPVSKRFDLETGIEYSKCTYRFSNSSLGPGYNIPHNAYLSLIEIPVTARFNFWQYFFLNGGLLLDFDVTKDKHLDNQTGTGALLGVGAKYNFKKTPIGIFINPYIKYRPLIPFTQENYHLRTMENGLRIGVVYNF